MCVISLLLTYCSLILVVSFNFEDLCCSISLTNLTIRAYICLEIANMLSNVINHSRKILIKMAIALMAFIFNPFLHLCWQCCLTNGYIYRAINFNFSHAVKCQSITIDPIITLLPVLYLLINLVWHH